MPELPDIKLYIDALCERIINRELLSIELSSPFLLRTVEPAKEHLFNHRVCVVRRVGKRIAIGLTNDHWLVLHLMIAGRLDWTDSGKKLPKRKAIAEFAFSSGTLRLTEAGSKRRASLHLFDSTATFNTIDRGGVEVLQCSLAEFSERLVLRNHTLKRALTDQGLFSGIGNAYSDEILHHARLSPIMMTQKMSREQIAALFASAQHVLQLWINALAVERGERFPEKVTAFRAEMAVHGKYQSPCPICDTQIQRIRYASNETNYCPRCQTEGKLLADRSLSRLLKKDWPKTIEALENATAGNGG